MGDKRTSFEFGWPRLSDTLVGVLAGAVLAFVSSYVTANYQAGRQEQLTLIKDRFDACLGLAGHFQLYADKDRAASFPDDYVVLPGKDEPIAQSSNEDRRQATFDTARVISECYADHALDGAARVQQCVSERTQTCDGPVCTPLEGYSVIDETGDVRQSDMLKIGSMNRAC